jgi:hypothetical protein
MITYKDGDYILQENLLLFLVSPQNKGWNYQCKICLNASHGWASVDFTATRNELCDVIDVLAYETQKAVGVRIEEINLSFADNKFLASHGGWEINIPLEKNTKKTLKFFLETLVDNGVNTKIEHFCRR